LLGAKKHRRKNMSNKGKIGLLAGMSWESSREYYKYMNQMVAERLGGFHSAKILIESFDFADIKILMDEGNWKGLEMIMANSAQKLEKDGANCIVIGTNTMHKVAPFVQEKINIPLIHIADATAEAIRKGGLKKVALLGTRTTMEEDFYKERIAKKYGIEVLIPEEEEDRIFIDEVIFNELCSGIINKDSRRRINRIIADLVYDGADGVIMGCTELPLLINEEALAVQENVKTLLYDTTRIHAQAAVDFALAL
jgi:aspartate racemase